MSPAIALALAVPWLLLSPVAGAGLYTKSSPVLQVDGRSYDKLIAKSNHTSIVEFYAPWCGHCQNLKPAYEKAATKLKGLAKVAAVNCDDEENKPFCGSMGVQGFPTLKIVRPGSKPRKPVVEDYQSARNAKAIVEAVVDKIPNHVKKLTDKTLVEGLKEGNDTARAILFTEKGTTSALLRAVAIDFLGTVNVAQIRDKEKKAVETFGIEEYPTFILLPGGDKEPVKYEGELKKESMVEFLSQIAPPNPDPAPAKSKAKSSTKDSQKASKASSSFSAASSSHKSADADSGSTATPSETLEDTSPPTDSPSPNVVDDETEKPIKVPDIPTLSTLDYPDTLIRNCLHPKASLCILAILPSDPSDTSKSPEEYSEAAANTVRYLAEISQKHAQRGAKIFPFFTLPASNEAQGQVRDLLSLKTAGTPEPEIIAVNAKRGFWKHYGRDEYSMAAIEDWIDALRMGEGKKLDLPQELIQEIKEEKVQEKADSGQKPIDLGDIKFEDQGEGQPKVFNQEGLEIELEEVTDDDDRHDEL
ncbi:MAG: hypothetical protein M1820_006814 [Bogoriella megaspora]|nr:MAG: hypothetical protein M1820_006814 [Bogoriella megaspora]